MIDASVEFTGPLFDGRADRVVGEYADAVERRVAEAAAVGVGRGVQRAARNPSGRYASTVRAERQGDAWSASDGGRLPYGSWLRGTSRRARSTGFGGYRHWELARQEAERNVQRSAAEVWPRFAAKLGGS